MINVRGIANGFTRGVNPNIDATLRVNTGYITDENYQQIPQFDEVPITIQPQSLKSSDKYHLDLINRQGEFISVYCEGDINAIQRVIQKGSSEMVFAPYGESELATWNVEQVMESFSTWCRLLLCRQRTQETENANG